MASVQDGVIPPLPPRMRPKPQQRDIGRLYANEAEFAWQMLAWRTEHAARAELMAERVRAQQRARDRSGRERGTDDNAQRTRRRRESNANVLPEALVRAPRLAAMPPRCHAFCAPPLQVA